jgi:hypothetical protein
LAVRYGGAGLVGGLVLSVVFGMGRLTPARAQASSGSNEASGTIAFTSGSAGSVQMLYVIDTKNQAFAVYRVDPQNGKGSIKLEAARQYRYDLRLAEYNNQPPEVSAIESMVGAPRR